MSADAPSTPTDQSKPAWFDDGLRFTCNQCGNCCTGPPGYVFFTEEESQAMADELGISVGQFLDQYTKKAGRKRTLVEVKTEHGFDCVFLRRDEQGRALCSVYRSRPHQCRTWPFWPENLGKEQAWLRSAQRCAGMAAGLEGEGKFFPAEQIRVIRDSHED